MKTFKHQFGYGGNEKDELDLKDWNCEKCGKILTFKLDTDGAPIYYKASCCDENYYIAPTVYAYYKESDSET